MEIKEIEKQILSSVKYVKKTDKHYLTASEASSDYLQLFLKRKHDIVDDEISQATLGSLAHKGLEFAFHNSDEASVEFPITHILDGTDTVLSATIDYLDVDNVIDWKTGKLNTAKKLREAISKGDMSHQYIIQLSHINFILNKIGVHTGRKYYIGWFFKDAGLNYRTGAETDTFDMMQIPVIQEKEYEDFIIEKALILEDFVNNDKMPPKCSDTWIANIAGVRTATKCRYYCSLNSVCPYYDSSNEESVKETEALDW